MVLTLANLLGRCKVLGLVSILLLFASGVLTKLNCYCINLNVIYQHFIIIPKHTHNFNNNYFLVSSGPNDLLIRDIPSHYCNPQKLTRSVLL